MQSSSNGGSNGLPPPLAEINVTPLVDVVLVLLIIFMVSAPLLETSQGVEVDVPETRQAEVLPTEATALVVTLTAKGEIYLGDAKAPQPLEGLEDKIRGILAAEPSKEVFFKGDRDVKYGLAVDVMARLRKGGVQSLGMVTKPPEEES